MAIKNPEMDSLKSDLRALDAKINLVVQKIKTIEKNEEIIGRTLVAYSERLKGTESAGGKQSARLDGSQSADIEGLKKSVDEIRQQVKELKYVLDTINPLEYATINQVKELIDDMLHK